MNEKPPASPGSSSLLEVINVSGVFADAVLTDERDSLLFASLWGRDTALQELLARVSVPLDQGGIRSLQLKGSDRNLTVQLDRMERIEKHTARMPPRNLFGDLVQLWLYDRLAVEPDLANRHALVLMPMQGSHEAADSIVLQYLRLWRLVRDVCHVPMLDAWQHSVLKRFSQMDWIQQLSGYGINAWRIDLGQPELEQVITQMIRAGELCLDEDVRHRSLQALQQRAA